MERLRISKIFKAGECYEIVTKYKEVPVRVFMRLNWAEDDGRLLGFDWGKTHLRAVFSTTDPVYVRLSPKEYAQTRVFSNMGKELVLMLENFVDPPDFIRRRFVRVEPDEHKPVGIEIEFDENRLETTVTDISEMGLGVVLDKKEHPEFIEFLKREVNNDKREDPLELRLIVKLPEFGTAEGKGRLRNVVSFGRDAYVKLGFETIFPKRELDKVRKYVIKRQKEIIKSLRIVE